MSGQRLCARILPVLAVFAVTCSDTAGLDQVVSSLSVDAPAVSPGDVFQAVLVLSNPTEDTVRFETPNSCLAMLRVFRDGQEAQMKGTMYSYGCRAVYTPHAIPPGEALVRTYDLEALLQEDHGEFVIPALPGIYLLRAELQGQLSVPNPEAEVQIEAVP